MKGSSTLARTRSRRDKAWRGHAPINWPRGEVYAGGGRWATYANATTYFNYADWLGTVRVNTQYGGGWTQTCQSLPFGDGQACTNGAGPSPDFFTGKPRDTESGDDYFGARYYNAAGNGNADLGRFMTPDWSADPEPVAYGDLSSPQTLNLYGYARSRPTTLADPDGHCPVCFAVVSGVIVGAASEAGAEFLRGQPLNLQSILASAAAGGVAGAVVSFAPEDAGTAYVFGKAIASALIEGGSYRLISGRAVLSKDALEHDLAVGTASAVPGLAVEGAVATKIVQEIANNAEDAVVGTAAKSTEQPAITSSLPKIESEPAPPPPNSRKLSEFIMDWLDYNGFVWPADGSNVTIQQIINNPTRPQ